MKSLARAALARFTQAFFTTLSWVLGVTLAGILIAMAAATPTLTIFEKALWVVCTWGIGFAGIVLALKAACRVDDALEDTALGASEAPGVITLFIILALTLSTIVLFEYMAGFHIFTRP